MSDLVPNDDEREGRSRLRASDADRNFVHDILSSAMSSGHLSPVEYEERAAKAVAAKTFGELDELTDDLPVNQLTTAGVATSRRVTTPSAGVEVITSRIAIMSGSELKGPVAVGEHLNAFALMGGVEIDLRDAEFTADHLTIRANTIMGGIEIVVPHDATVRITGMGIMGGFGGSRNAEGKGIPGAPIITVSGLAIMGGVEVVRRRPRDAT
ncbi:DUF1707 SHOCT-like domain-containing protein [Williamsia muralis]|uniref:DUF1707 SHOCT-like domain-containing protein n=1 Tax=Williamsia marianensis TaxID=85044 RepID=UPI001CB96FE1|nr:DUF1707 domain-containing protein [Williamsia marianensis]